MKGKTSPQNADFADSNRNEARAFEVPVAMKKPVRFEKHGVVWHDEYYWLREREHPEVIAHLEAENAYTEAIMEGFGDLKEDLFQEMKGRMKEQDMSVPYTLNGYSYYTRYELGKEHPFHCRKQAGGDDEELMLDVNLMAMAFPYYNAVGLQVSDDNRYLAFGEDTLGRRVYTLRFKDLKTGAFLTEEIPGTTGGTVWSKDGRAVFYTKKDPETLRSFQVYRHWMGRNTEEDELIFQEDDEAFYAQAGRSKSREYLLIGATSTLTSEWHVLRLDRPEETPKVIQPRIRGLEYDIDHIDHSFYIRHNLEGRNFMLSRCGVDERTKAHWIPVLPHREEVLLEGFELFSDFLVTEERVQGLTRLFVRSRENMQEGHQMVFADPAYMAYISVNPEVNTHILRYGYTSLTTPNSVYDYDMRSRKSTLLKQQEVMGDFDPAHYVSERLMVTARDGAEVPVSIVYRKGFTRDGNKPLLLYGYGSYGLSMDPYFSIARLSLLDRGFAFAIAHIRGGEELGRAWYEDGKLLKKKNTFYDFIDCAEYLLEQNYTSQKGLFAMGGSAGGLLMGAVINMRPELWAGIVAQVPFVDVINTMLDTSIPLTTGEYDEWGNPDEEAFFHYIRSYSPYDNVSPQRYPHMLVTTGIHDSQVQYWEPAKWVAKLRELKTDDNLLLLHTEMTTGHGGASGRFERLREIAMEYAFLLMLAGIR